MRNKIQTKQNFDSLINENNSILPIYFQNLQAQKDDEIKEKILFRIFNYLLEMSIAHYSKGSSKEIVKQSVKETILAFEKGFVYEYNPDGVFGAADHMIWTTSLALLCDVDIEYFEKIAAILKRDGVKDSLLNFILKSKFPDWEAESGWVQEPPYINLQPVLDTEIEEEGIQLLKNYLQNIWYQEHKGREDELQSYWIDYHKKSKDLPRNSPHYHPDNIFFGYWAWETGAIVKIKGWDDEPLKDLDYYPYDAVHW